MALEAPLMRDRMWVSRVTPYVLIMLGLYILVESRAYAVIVS